MGFGTYLDKVYRFINKSELIFLAKRSKMKPLYLYKQISFNCVYPGLGNISIILFMVDFVLPEVVCANIEKTYYTYFDRFSL